MAEMTDEELVLAFDTARRDAVLSIMSGATDDELLALYDASRGLRGLLLYRLAELRAEVEKSHEAYGEWSSRAFDLFVQGTWDQNRKKYAHNCISAYEEAQCALIAVGSIEPEECEYGCCDEHFPPAPEGK